jgi:hypothetical protein
MGDLRIFKVGRGKDCAIIWEGVSPVLAMAMNPSVNPVIALLNMTK